MAIYHLNSGFVSRSTGRSSVQSAAYITGEKLHESRRNLEINYRNRHSDIAFTDTLAPNHAPKQFHQVTVWDLLENFEDTYADKLFPKNLDAREKYLNSAQTAQTIVVALPRELSVEVGKELVEEFAKERFVSRGLVVTYAIHDDEGNPHAHLQISRRSVDEKGVLSRAKDRDIVTRKSLLETRKLWADLTNWYLEREGFAERITEKSFAALGINLEPTAHRGWVADKLKSMGVSSRILAENAEVFARNREVLQESPQVILPELTKNQATFTQVNLLKAIQKRIGDDDQCIAQVFEEALKAAVVVGEGMDGQVRYTSPEYQVLESHGLEQLDVLKETTYEQPNITRERCETHLASHFLSLSEEQQQAVLGLMQDSRLQVLVGRAGAGKTTTLKAVSEIYQEAGHRVIGTSLSALAAENLGNEAGIPSATLHSWLYQWNRYQEAQEKFLSFTSVMEEGFFKQLDWYQDLQRFESSKLTKDTVLIVDEAGMVGTRQWGELLSYVNRSGAKLIAVGDDNQFKAIEAGDFFRELTYQAFQTDTLWNLKTIHRQHHKWMRIASHHMAILQIAEGLSLYEKRGYVHQVERSTLSEEIARAYLEKHKQGQEGLVLAFTNEQVKELNQAIREQLKREGILGKRDLVRINGYQFALGEKIVFLQNDRTLLQVRNQKGEIQENFYIKNGTTGTITRISDNGDIHVALRDNQQTIIPCHRNTSKVALGQEPMKEYAYTSIAPGYAVTTHKSQGQTVDFALVAASKNMDAKGLYVAMTRHREDVQLFYAKEDFTSFKALTSQLSRYEVKDLVKDYTILPQNEEAWQRVQEYRLCALDAAAVLKESTIDWQSYHQIKRDQVHLGKEILKDFDHHQLYLHQAGLTQEMLEITTGGKARPLSYAEEKAKLTVELYGEQAQLAKEIGREIRKTHPGVKCYKHKLYGKFKEAQQERNSLAYVIAQNHSLHREFIKGAWVHGIPQKAIIAQAQQFIQQQRETPIRKDQQMHTIPFTRTFSQRFSVDPAVVREELNSRIKELAYEFLGTPHQQKATEWRYGSKGSMSIQVAGQKRGLYSNFETGESGNALKFIQDQLNCDHRQAFKWGVEWLKDAGALERETSRIPIKSSPLKSVETKQEWQMIPPKDKVNLKEEPQLAYMLKGRQEVARYEYQAAEGYTLGYVVRLEDKDGNKITPTLTYCCNQDGKEQWRWQGFGNDRPLYGLEQLKQKPEAPVLVVEGEKTCEAARELFKDYVVITWSGGCGAVQKSDWSVLANRDITIWPDHDQPGMKAAEKIADILQEQGTPHVAIVDLPDTLPQKWDLADPIPEHVNVKELVNRAQGQELIESEQDHQEKLESITHYLTEATEDKRNAWIGSENIEHTLNILSKDPYAALHCWQELTDDTSFTPLTRAEEEIKQQQAQAMLDQAMQTLNPGSRERLSNELPHHAQGVITTCQEYLDRHQQVVEKMEMAEFKHLYKKHEIFVGKEREEVGKRLDELSERYAHNPEFLKMIDTLDDKKMHDLTKDISQKQASEPDQDYQQKQEREIYRGFER